MEEKRRIEESLQNLQNLKLLAQAHEEVSTIRIRLARGSVLATRDFLTSLLEVFVNVKSAYKKHLLAQMEKNKQDNKSVHLSTIPKNGKEVFVFISANNKLYGSIIPKVFSLFRESCMKKDADIAIVGKLGRELYDASDIKKPYTYFNILDTEKDFVDLKPLTTYIFPYENVTLFYGKFINVVTQEATITNITGEESLTENAKATKEYDFIFEPSIEEVMNFFETQTFFSLFKQAIHESELAKYGSRITAMEEALEIINRDIHVYGQVEKRVRNLMANKKQLERIAGMKFWKK